MTFLLLSHTGGRPRVTVTHSRRQRTPKGNAEWMKRWMNSFLWMNLLPPLRQGDRPISLPSLHLVTSPPPPPFSLSFPLFFLFFPSRSLYFSSRQHTSRASINLSSELTYSLLPLPLLSDLERNCASLNVYLISFLAIDFFFFFIFFLEILRLSGFRNYIGKLYQFKLVPCVNGKF